MFAWETPPTGQQKTRLWHNFYILWTGIIFFDLQFTHLSNNIPSRWKKKTFKSQSSSLGSTCSSRFQQLLSKDWINNWVKNFSSINTISEGIGFVFAFFAPGKSALNYFLFLHFPFAHFHFFSFFLLFIPLRTWPSLGQWEINFPLHLLNSHFPNFSVGFRNRKQNFFSICPASLLYFEHWHLSLKAHPRSENASCRVAGRNRTEPFWTVSVNGWS